MTRAVMLMEFVERGTTGKGLESTRYGQVALSLDPTGTLAQRNMAKRASFFVD